MDKEPRGTSRSGGRVERPGARDADPVAGQPIIPPLGETAVFASTTNEYADRAAMPSAGACAASASDSAETATTDISMIFRRRITSNSSAAEQGRDSLLLAAGAGIGQEAADQAERELPGPPRRGQPRAPERGVVEVSGRSDSKVLDVAGTVPGHERADHAAHLVELVDRARMRISSRDLPVAIGRPTVSASRIAGASCAYFASAWMPSPSSTLLKKQRAAAARTTSSDLGVGQPERAQAGRRRPA